MPEEGGELGGAFAGRSAPYGDEVIDATFVLVISRPLPIAEPLATRFAHPCGDPICGASNEQIGHEGEGCRREDQLQQNTPRCTMSW